jgi:hypothetical protein
MRNPRWIPENAADENPFGSELPASIRKLVGIAKGKDGAENDYTKSDSLTPPPVTNVANFVNADGMKVQIICSRYEGSDLMQASLYPARMVDLICCGVVMNTMGEVMEVLPDAHKDCREGILRLNRESDTLHTKTLASRVKKLEERGWQNMVDVEKVIREIEADRARQQRRKQLRAKQGRQTPNGLFETFLFGPDVDRIRSGGSKGSYADYNKYCSKKQLVKFLETVAFNNGKNIRLMILPNGQIEVMAETANDLLAINTQVLSFFNVSRRRLNEVHLRRKPKPWPKQQPVPTPAPGGGDWPRPGETRPEQQTPAAMERRLHV